MQTRLAALVILAASAASLQAPNAAPLGPCPEKVAAVARAVAHALPCGNMLREHVSIQQTSAARPGGLVSLEIVCSSGGVGGRFKLNLQTPEGSLGAGGDPLEYEFDIPQYAPVAKTVNVKVATATHFPIAAQLARLGRVLGGNAFAEHRIMIVPTTGALPASYEPDATLDAQRVASDCPPLMTLASGERVAVLLSPGR